MKVSPSNHSTTGKDNAPATPATWDLKTLQANLEEHLVMLANDEETTVPVERLLLQLRTDSFFRDTVSRWANLNGQQRVNAWRNLVHLSNKYAHEVIPACLRCGECCRNGSPTLQLDDLELLQENKIPWDQLVTLRKGEPVSSPQTGKPFFLLDERIKIREKEGTKSCVFFEAGDNSCRIYSDRPVQCRAQACWDPSASEELAKQPYLTRKDLFKDVQLLLDLLAEHDRRCGFEKLNVAFRKLAEQGDSAVDDLLELLRYEDHFRNFVAKELNIPAEVMPLVFGRSFTELVQLFGFRVEVDEDGTRRLVAEDSSQ